MKIFKNIYGGISKHYVILDFIFNTVVVNLDNSTMYLAFKYDQTIINMKSKIT